LLWIKLQKLGVNGSILEAVKGIYSNVNACVKDGPYVKTVLEFK
jgi:hypothetical protein